LEIPYNSSEDEVSITVVANNTSKQPPVAIAKAGGEIVSSEFYNMGYQAVGISGNGDIRTIDLDGGNSFDPDGGNITEYTWNLDQVIVYSWKDPETGEYVSDSWQLDPCHPRGSDDDSTAPRWSTGSIKWCHPDESYEYRAEIIGSENLDNSNEKETFLPFPSDALRTYHVILTVKDDEGITGSDDIAIHLDPFQPDTTLFTLTVRSPTQPSGGGGGQPSGGGGGQPDRGGAGPTTPSTGRPYSGLRDIEDPNNSAIQTSPGTSSSSPAPQNDFLVYQNNTFAVKIEYPSSWSKAEKDTNSLDRFSEIVSFYSPLQNSSDRYPEKVLLKVSDVGGQNRSLDDYLYDTINYNIANSTEFQIIQADTNATVAARPAYKLIYNHMILENNTAVQTMEIGTIIGDKLYAISFNAEPVSYPSYYSAYVQRMLSSFEITNNNDNSR
jgi:hypothetical protein